MDTIMDASDEKDSIQHTTSSQKNMKKMAKNSNQYLSAKKMVLKKYRKQRFGVRKKYMGSIQNVLNSETVHSNYKLKRQHDQSLQSHEVFSNSSPQMEDVNLTFVTSSLSQTNVCSEFPISEIGSELSGNRGNGNSPFNSSNSCGSPESAVMQNSYPQRVSEQIQISELESSRFSSSKQCDKYSPPPEPNNNQQMEDHCSCHTEGAALSKDSEESIIDVVSLDEEENPVSQGKLHNASDAFDVEECLDKRPSLSVDVSLANQHSSDVPLSPCKTSQQSYSHSSPSPVNWQQQFMSFLSTPSIPDSQNVEQLHISSSKSPSSHSSRKKRSPKVRNSVCPCCIGSSHSSHGKRQKHHRGHSRKHGLSREHKHFIRDMVQLVSLRNKVVALFCSVFPQCRDLILCMNADSEKVDMLIDQVVDTLQMPETLSLTINTSGDDKGETVYSDSGTDPLDLSEYPSLEKPDDVLFEDKDSDDMPILDDYSADDKSQDTEGSVSNNKSFSDDYLAFLGKTNYEKTKDDGSQEHSSILENDSKLQGFIQKEYEDFVSKDCTRVFSEGDSGILKDHDISTSVSEDIDSGVQNHYKQGPCFEESDNTNNNCNRMCNTICKTEPCVLIRPIDQDENISCNQDNFQVSFQEFLTSSKQDTCKSDTEVLTTGVNSDTHENGINNLELDSDHEEEESGRKQISYNKSVHVTAYSDISEASQMSCNSPCEWTIGSEALSSNKQSSKRNGYLNDIDDRISSLSSKHCRYLPVTCDKYTDNSCKTRTIEIYESYVETCKKPKLCLKALKYRINTLLTWLLPGAKLGNGYFKNLDNLEYLLDALIFCNSDHSEEETS